MDILWREDGHQRLPLSETEVLKHQTSKKPAPTKEEVQNYSNLLESVATVQGRKEIMTALKLYAKRNALPLMNIISPATNEVVNPKKTFLNNSD